MVREIDLDRVQELLKSGAQLVDVMPPAEYRRIHPKGAVNLPLKKLSQKAASTLDPERAIIVYCYDYQ